MVAADQLACRGRIGVRHQARHVDFRLNVVGLGHQRRLERFRGIGSVVFLREELAPAHVGGHIVRRQLIGLTEVGVGLLELSQRSPGFAETSWRITLPISSVDCSPHVTRFGGDDGLRLLAAELS